MKRDERWVPKQYHELREAAVEQLALLADPAKSGPWPPASDKYLEKAAQEGSVVTSR